MMAIDREAYKTIEETALMVAAKGVVESIGGALEAELVRRCAEKGITVEANFDIKVTAVNPDTLKSASRRRR